MKKLLTGLLTISSIGLLMLASCKKSDKLVTDAGSTSSTLSVSTSSPALSTAMINDTASIITFNLTAPKYTYKAGGTSNALQVAVGNNWKNAATTQLSSTSQGFSTFALAKLLLGLNLTAGVQTQVNVRVVNQLSAETALYSNIITLTVTPINLASWVYVPGDYEGWNNSSAADSLVSATSNGVYTGLIYFPPGGTFQFKVVPVKGSWNVAYGDAGGGAISTSGGNLSVPGTGEYWITVDLNKNTITAVPADFYSVIGDAAQGWSTDIAMKYINDGKQNWVVSLPLVASGSFKVRQDDQWTNSWGIPKSGSAGFGVANTLNSTSNNNISVSANGTYTVSFNAAPSTVTTGTSSLVTTTYSVTQ